MKKIFILDSYFKLDGLIKIKNNKYQFFRKRKNTEHHSSCWSTIGY